MYFIAIVAPGDINEKIKKWKQLMMDRFGCTAALRSPAHVTLIPPFWMEEGLEDKLYSTMNDCCRQQRPVEINIKNFDAFVPKVIYAALLINKSLVDLHEHVRQYMITSGLFALKKEQRPFHPHMTIATRDLHKKAFTEAWSFFKEKEYTAQWMVNSISLLKHDQKKWDVVHTSLFSN
jgi:2'-5' RNA ligase